MPDCKSPKEIYIHLYSCWINLDWFDLLWFYGISTIVGYLMPNPFLYIRVLFQRIQFSISRKFKMSKTILFQTIQLSIGTLFISILPIDGSLSGTTTLGLMGPWSNGNEGKVHISQISNISRASPLDCLVSYAGNSLGKSFFPLCWDVFSNPSWLSKSD